MANSGSITRWFRTLRDGDRDGVQQLWDRFSRRLLALARGKLAGVSRRSADEEDVVLSAFDSFCRGVEGGRFGQLADRDDLWTLLVTITVRKAINLRVYETAQKRGGPAVPDDSMPLDAVLGRDPDPALAVALADEFGHLMDKLGDTPLRPIALLKMDGFTDAEIAAKLGCTERTVRRRVKLIRQTLERGAAPP